MEPLRRPSGRRVLLPFEAEICNTLDLSEDEYWHFVALTEEYNGKQPEGYELIPEIRNDPVSIIVNIVIGIALSAIAALLAPKPKQPKREEQRANLQTESITGKQRFTPTNNFDSIQELATLGETIPLVYTRNGLRVSSQLLWSQLQSYGTGQQLSAILLISHGELGAAPEFAGYAIGDTLLENYTNAKLKLFWRSNGGRLSLGNAYPQGTLDTGNQNDQFAVKYDATGQFEPMFSGTRSPSTQSQFGMFSPMPNGMRYKVEYELVLVQRNMDGDEDDDVIADQKTKKRKIKHQWPHRAGIVGGDSYNCIYSITGEEENPNQFEPWGTEDVRSATESSRVNADTAISVGEQYAIGNTLAVCVNQSSSDIWEHGLVKSYQFRFLENYNGFEAPGPYGLARPFEYRTIQRVAVAAITNNRACHATEIGIKSTVYKRLNGTPNLNSQPSDDVIERYEYDRAFIGLGSLNIYVTRYSFFTLQVRALGGSAWYDISQGKVFAVKGRTPQAQYNYIRITQNYGQYEYRLVPYAGNSFYRFRLGSPVFLLKPGSVYTYSVGGFTVSFSGVQVTLGAADVSNSEWVLGGPGSQPYGDVVAFNTSQKGSIPVAGYNYEQTKYSTRYRVQEDLRETGSGRGTKYIKLNTYLWNNEVIGESPRDVDYIVVGRYKYEKGRIRSGRGNRYYEIKRYVSNEQILPPDRSGQLSPPGGRGAGLRVAVNTWNNNSAQWSIIDPGKGYRNGDKVTLQLGLINGNVDDIQVSLTISGRQATVEAVSINPFDAISDYWQYDSEQPSHVDGPEHEVVYVNEQVINTPAQYNDLAIAGLKINSSTEWSSFSNFSAYVTNGIKVSRLIDDNKNDVAPGALVASTNLFPEIAYDLLTDPLRGAGELIGASQVDRERMQLSAKFCKANGFFWDGAITDNQNLRQFIYEMAGFCLLDFTILGGQFSLYPSVPFSSNHTINQKGKPAIKALFTDGNIRDLKVSFLPPEDREAFRATVLYREEVRNGFSQTKVYSGRLATTPEGAPEETFDLAAFCTSLHHAATFARVALQLRDKVDHSVQFQTTPQAAMGLLPGEYIRIVSEAIHSDRFENGSIDNAGKISAASMPANGATIMCWKPGTEGVWTATMTVVDGFTPQTELWGIVFAVQNSVTTSRVYKVESLTYGEDGLLEVTGSHVALTEEGTIAYLDWTADDFVETVG